MVVPARWSIACWDVLFPRGWPCQGAYCLSRSLFNSLALISPDQYRVEWRLILNLNWRCNRLTLVAFLLSHSSISLPSGISTRSANRKRCLIISSRLKPNSTAAMSQVFPSPPQRPTVRTLHGYFSGSTLVGYFTLSRVGETSFSIPGEPDAFCNSSQLYQLPHSSPIT